MVRAWADRVGHVALSKFQNSTSFSTWTPLPYFQICFSRGSLELESQERHSLLLARLWLSLLGDTVGYRPGPKSQGSVFWFTATMGRADIACSAKEPTMSPTDGSKDLMSKVFEIATCKHIMPSAESLSH